MGNQSATDEQVVEAAKKAHCHEFIEKLPQGYQTVISEGGASLSGGELKRIELATVLARGTQLSVFDANLLIEKKTVVMIAHKLSIVKNADQILVLSDGILQGCGKHEELLQTVPLYQTMWEKEKSIKNWKLV